MIPMILLVATLWLRPGVPPLDTLVRIGGVPAYGRAQTAEGEFVPIRLFRSYWARHVEDQDPILFINAANGYIASVDDAPLNPSAPFWYDTGMVNAAGHYIPDGRPSCQWKRAGSPEDEKT